MALILLMRAMMAVFSHLAPVYSAQVFLWFTLQTRRRRASAKPCSSRAAQRVRLPAPSGGEVVLHTYQPANVAGAPRVLLVHGWNGAATDWEALARTLQERGFAVTAADMPAHGASDGRSSSLPRFVRALQEIDRRHGPFEVWIGHSMGAAAVVAALARGARARRVVLINGLVTPAGALRGFARHIGLSPAATAAYLRAIELRENMTLAELDAAHNARRVAAEVLIVHDEHDRTIPLSEAQRLAQAWAGARFMRTSGLGHRRILQDARVAGVVAAFAAASEAQTLAPAA
ncbi:MAG TPA: alpha/beta fold hydrolase [Burkholderiaceae bacterium]|nr:alpha/beta fold hydrolase [Burkholderiaceae bacterium]